MSKDLARGPESYVNEQMVLAMVPELLRAKGFEAVRIEKRNGMKFVNARSAYNLPVVFWLKQGWSNTRRYSAIQFGMFADVTDPKAVPDSYFLTYVADRTASAKRHGATHALLVHMVDSDIQNYVALRVEDVAEAYRRQIRGWPARARNTKTPTLYFEDSRGHPDSASVQAVTALEIPLEQISGIATEDSPAHSGPGSKKVTAEVERRLRQQRFRVLVGNRCGWRCAVTGTSVREVPEAAHLPGRDWRVSNQPTDGVLLRADLHRLLDEGLAVIRGDRFVITDRSRAGEYSVYNGKSIAI